jgi:hypothetical protein
MTNVEPRGTVSYTNLPVSQGARDLMMRLALQPVTGGGEITGTLDILAAADPKDVTNLLWARRAGKL